MEPQDDIPYIRKVLSGDSKAYAFLVDKYKAMTYTLALRIAGNAQDAEEISQDAFVKAYKALPAFKQESAFSTWLYRIVYNTAISKTRKKKLDTTSLDTNYLGNYVAVTQTTFQGMVREDQQKYIQAAMHELTAEESTLIYLHYTEEKSMEEIGMVTGLTAANVRVKLFRARKKLYIHLHKMLKNGKEDLL